MISTRARAPRPILASTLLILLGAFVGPPNALAIEPEVACESSQLKAAAKYSSCLLKTRAKALRKDLLDDDGSSPVDLTCEEKFSKQMTKSREKAGPDVCPNGGGQLTLKNVIEEKVGFVSSAAATDLPPSDLFVEVDLIVGPVDTAVTTAIETSGSAEFDSELEFSLRAVATLNPPVPEAVLKYQFCCEKNSFPFAGQECDNTAFPLGGFCSDSLSDVPERSFNSRSRQFQIGDYLWSVVVTGPNDLKRVVGPFTVRLLETPPITTTTLMPPTTTTTLAPPTTTTLMPPTTSTTSTTLEPPTTTTSTTTTMPMPPTTSMTTTTTNTTTTTMPIF